MPTGKASVKMDENGRVTIPKPLRQKLGVDGEEVIIDIEATYEGG